MSDLVRQVSSRIFSPSATPASTVSISVQRKALQSAVGITGVHKRGLLPRTLPLGERRRVTVEAAEGGTNDSIFFVPERPNVNESHTRVSVTEFIKINPNEHGDVVRAGDDFEISFVGMSVAQQDCLSDTDLLLCSLARKEDCFEYGAYGRKQPFSAGTSSTDERTGKSDEPERVPTKPHEVDVGDLPAMLPMRPGDLPFLHYDAETDGSDSGSKLDTFVSVPGTKRLFVQRRGASIDKTSTDIRGVAVRFTVMQIDPLDEAQQIAIRSMEEVAKSIRDTANSGRYLKLVSWLVKLANMLGHSAIKKVPKPGQVMSSDLSFMLAPDDDPKGPTIQREEYGNYLRVSSATSTDRL